MLYDTIEVRRLLFKLQGRYDKDDLVIKPVISKLFKNSKKAKKPGRINR